MSKNMLVAYYSWSCGNTEKIAEQLANACNADIARIETVELYPEDYQETVDQGQREVNAGFMPEIEPFEFNPENYDVIVIGTPTWWYTMAPAVKTFTSMYDFTGKTVVALSTNGSWPGNVTADIEDACAGATFGPALEVQFDSTGGDRQETPQREVDSWIEKVRSL